MLVCRIFAVAAMSLCVPGVAFAQDAVRITRAGVARVDITPPPGYSTGGHGPSGATPRGYWGPLTATAFYFEDSRRKGAALVSVDVFGIPSAVHQDVATVFASRGSQATLALERIVIAATHTHHGTANYLSTAVHNKRASNEMGYDARLRTFIVQRIVEAVDAAIVDALAHPSFDVHIITGMLKKDLFRNRSPKVFLNNTNAEATLDALAPDIPPEAARCIEERRQGEPDEYWDLKGCPRLRAVDRGVSLLRIRRAGHTAALAVFIAVHPTLLPSKTPLFSQDVFGIARNDLEDSGGGIANVAFFNGAEGDITMRRTSRDAVDLVTSGRTLARQLRSIHDNNDARSITAAGIEGRLHFAQPGDEVPSSGTAMARLARKPLGGPAALRGGEDDPGPPLAFTLTKGVPFTRKPTGEHGVKVPAVRGWEWLTYAFFPVKEFPQRFPLGIVRIGELSLATVPFEMTTAVGYALRSAFGLPRGKFEIIGLAGEYAMYTSSREEYQKQDYMGAFTLWGPEQALFVVKSLELLRSGPSAPTGTPPADEPGRKKRLGPHKLPRNIGVFDGLELLLGHRHPPAFCWEEPAPPDLPKQVTRSIEVRADDGSSIDNRQIVAAMLGKPRNGKAKWTAIWLKPVIDPPPAGLFRFTVTTPERLITSVPFSAADITVDCTTFPIDTRKP